MRTHFTLLRLLSARTLSTIVGAFVVPGVLMAQARGSAAGTARGVLVLDGSAVSVRKMEGGAVVADVITEPGPAGASAKKRLGPVRYESFVMDVGLDTKVMLDWIAASWTSVRSAKSGSVVTVDYAGSPLSERTFANGLITETTIPALDAASREPGYLTVRVTPEIVRTVPPTRPSVMPPKPGARQWTLSGFRLDLGGLETRGVTRIESFTVKRHTANDSARETRDNASTVGEIDFPNLTISVDGAASQSRSWIDWHESFLVKGDNDDGRERSGEIVLVGTDGKAEVATIALSNCGIFGLARTIDASARGGEVLKVQIYCEQMAFKPRAVP